MNTQNTDYDTGVINTGPEDEALSEEATTEIDRLTRRLETLEIKAGQIQSRDLSRQHREIEALDQQRDTIQDDVLELRTKEGTAWEALRTRIEVGLTELEESINKLLGEADSSD